MVDNWHKYWLRLPNMVHVHGYNSLQVEQLKGSYNCF